MTIKARTAKHTSNTSAAWYHFLIRSIFFAPRFWETYGETALPMDTKINEKTFSTRIVAEYIASACVPKGFTERAKCWTKENTGKSDVGAMNWFFAASRLENTVISIGTLQMKTFLSRAILSLFQLEKTGMKRLPESNRLSIMSKKRHRTRLIRSSIFWENSIGRLMKGFWDKKDKKFRTINQILAALWRGENFLCCNDSQAKRSMMVAKRLWEKSSTGWRLDLYQSWSLLQSWLSLISGSRYAAMRAISANIDKN